MKTIKDLKQMISEPASKEWFEKHGGAKKAIAKKMRGKNDIKRNTNPIKQTKAQYEQMRERHWGSNDDQ